MILSFKLLIFVIGVWKKPLNQISTTKTHAPWREPIAFSFSVQIVFQTSSQENKSVKLSYLCLYFSIPTYFCLCYYFGCKDTTFFQYGDSSLQKTATTRYHRGQKVSAVRSRQAPGPPQPNFWWMALKKLWLPRRTKRTVKLSRDRFISAP